MCDALLSLRFLLTYSSAAGQPPLSKSPPRQLVELPIPSSTEPTEDVMDVDVESQPQPQSQTDATQPLPTPHGAVSDTGLPVQSIQESFDSRGNRIVIIEELDTPATRREKTRRAKAERARLAAEATTHTETVMEASGSGERDHVAASTLVDPALHFGQEESELSSLSGDSDEANGDREAQASTTGRGRSRGRAQAQGKAGQPKSPGLGDISLPPGERLESGTLGISLCHFCVRISSNGNYSLGETPLVPLVECCRVR